MKFPAQIEFEVVKRPNIHAPNGTEFAVNCNLDGKGWYTLTVFPTCPTDMLVGEIKELVLRSMSIYHRHIELPIFKLEEI